jgi:glycosyltransferase involved in cell wall biosynthesis
MAGLVWQGDGRTTRREAQVPSEDCPMKIVVVASFYAPVVSGGSELVAQNQAEALAARGHAVCVLTLGEPGSGVVRTTLNGVAVVRVECDHLYFRGAARPSNVELVAWHARDMYNGRMAAVVREHVCAWQADVVVCHSIHGWSAAVWPAIRSLGIPVVQVLHDLYLRCIRFSMYDDRRCKRPCTSCRVFRLPHRHLSRSPTAAVGVSRFVIDNLVDAGYFKSIPLRTHLYNVSHLDTRARPTPPLEGQNVVFGFIGAVSAPKGIEVLLAAFSAVAQPHWRLRIAGSGTATYEQTLRAHCADERIEFLGRQDPATFYLGLDVTVVPSLLNDSFPNVVLESLIHGRPVIAARRGGIPEMVEEGSSGLLFEPETEGELESALVRFASEIEAWRSRQRSIKADAAPKYCDRDAWATSWESLLELLVSQTKAAAQRHSPPVNSW